MPLLQVADYILDDVNNFLLDYFRPRSANGNDPGIEANKPADKGCLNVLQAFLDYVSAREAENFRLRHQENENAVTLTTIHQVEVSNRDFFPVLCPLKSVQWLIC